MLGRYVVGGCLSLPDVKNGIIIPTGITNSKILFKSIEKSIDISQSANSFNLTLGFSVFL